MSWSRDTWLVFRQSFWSLLRSKSTWLVFGFALLYVLVAVISMHRVGDRENQDVIFAQVTLTFFVMIIIPLLTTWLGVASVRDEITQGTILHLLVRPVPRSAIWFGKYLAAWLMGLLLLSIAFGLALVLAKVVAPQAGFGRTFLLENQWPFLQALLYGPIVYPALGLFFGLRFRWSMVWALAFILIWEDFVSVTPSGSGARTLTISDSMRTLIYHASHEDSAIRNILSDFSLREKDVEIPTANSARQMLAWFFFLSLILANWSGARREFLSAEKET
jgi:ABC-type transport system involved in multi-copper enzyme maturation permease subunit